MEPQVQEIRMAQLTSIRSQRPGILASSGLTVYLAVAFAGTWALTAPIVASEQGWIAPVAGTEWHALGALGPFLAAVIVARRSSRAGEQLAAGLARWRVSVWYYLAALSPLLFLAPAAAITRVVDGAWPAVSRLGQSTRLSGGGWLLALALPAIAYAIAEEMGWRGVALPRLQARFAPITASLILGGIWVVWHIPFYLYREGMVDAPFAEQIAQGVVILIGGLFLAWLYNSTGGSIVLCAIWHFTHSVVHIATPEVSQTWDTYSGVLSTILAIVVTAIWWRRMSVHRTVTYPPTVTPLNSAIATGERRLHDAHPSS
jgi:membrane protease YdiL (CAAX protease family)